jgi:hypothetical protein
VVLSTISILSLLLTNCCNFNSYEGYTDAHVFGISEGAETTITVFYSCDAKGNPQDYFPKKSRAHLNVTVTNLAYDSKNVSLHLTVHDELNVPIGSDQLSAVISPNVSAYYIMSIFIPKWAYVGIATAYVSLWVEGISVDAESTRFYIGPQDLAPPVINLLSPKNVTYATESVPLVFRVDERTSWASYSLNNQENMTLTGNTTLTSLENGSYSIRIYANDTSGNMGSSEKVNFIILIMHDVAVVNLNLLPTEVYVGQIVNITVVVKNEGTVTEDFNVTAYANATAIEIQTVTTLFPSNQTTVVFEWNTTGFAKGNFTMSTYVTPLPREMDTIDNNCVGGIVNIKLRPDIEVTNIKPSKTFVGQGYSISINVTVRNQGDYTETFNITAYATTTAIGAFINITLTTGNITTVTFTWNTSGFAKGNYTISAYAWPVPGETDTADNTSGDGTILVTIPGDVNGDKAVEGKDIASLAKWFGKETGQLGYSPNLDVNGDGMIEGKDIVIVAKNFGKTYP